MEQILLLKQKQMAKDKLTILGDALESVMHTKDTLKEQMEALEQQEEEIRAQLIKGLLSKGIQFIKTTSGLAFGVVQGRKTFPIKKGMEGEALSWVQKNYPAALSVSAAKLTKILKPMLPSQLPDFVEEKVGEPHLSVRGSEEVEEPQ